MKHAPATPLPHMECTTDGVLSYLDREGRSIALTGEADEAHIAMREELARRANAYPQLVAALRLTVALCDKHGHAGKKARALLRELGEAE